MLKSGIVLAAAAAAMMWAVNAQAATVTIINTENEDLYIQVFDQNAAGAPMVLPANGSGCTHLAAGDSVTVNASTNQSGAYSLGWSAEQDVARPLAERSTCSGQPNDQCHIEMAQAQGATRQCG
jgi:hypothetical protein